MAVMQPDAAIILRARLSVKRSFNTEISGPPARSLEAIQAVAERQA
jgi:hypothetical protein